MSNGKGDKPRPLSVPREEYEASYERIFKVHDDDFDAMSNPIRYKCHKCGEYREPEMCDLPKCPLLINVLT